MFILDYLSFYQTICNRVHNPDTCLTQRNYHEIDALKFIPREARDLLRIALRIAIDLPKGQYLFKDFVKVKRWRD